MTCEIRLKDDSIFRKSAETGLEYVRSVDVDRLLAPSYEMHGLTPPDNAVRYGGWEKKGASNWEKSSDTFTLAGHSLGHWMSAAASFYSELGDKSVLEKLNYAVDRLYELQQRTGSGYIGGCPEKTFTEMFSGNERWYEGYWVPWYGIHKIYQGLMDTYELTGSEKSFRVLKRFADWAEDGISHLSDEQMQAALDVEYGGMNEVFAVMHRYTGDKRYLDAAVRFTHDRIIEPLSHGRDELSGLHANTQIPKIIGAAAIYNENNDPSYRAACENFFKIVTGTRSYAIGGNSIAEHFEMPGLESLGVKTCESCNTYNMLRLTEYLFSWDQRSEYADFYENALYNHILGQQEPETGAKMYFVSLLQGHHRVYEKKYESWWCCTGTGMENPGRYTRFICADTDDASYINLYIPCVAVFKKHGLKLDIETDYPYDETVRITVLEGCENTSLKFRVPCYASRFEVFVNGKRCDAKAGSDGYADITREWKEGDRAELKIGMDISVYRARNGYRAAFKYGPITLAAPLGDIDEIDGVYEYISNETKIDTVTDEVPYIISPDLSEVIKAVDISKLIFKIDGKYVSTGMDIILAPFYSIHHKFYNVYWDINREQDVLSKRLNDVTVDKVQPDGQQDELGHGFMTNTYSPVHQGMFKNGDKTLMYRSAWGITDAQDGERAYISYRMSVCGGDNFLCAAYREASDITAPDGALFNRGFDIFADGVKIGEESGSGKDGYVFYKIPGFVTDGKSEVTIKLAAKTDKSYAEFVELRITKSDLNNS